MEEKLIRPGNANYDFLNDFSSSEWEEELESAHETPKPESPLAKLDSKLKLGLTKKITKIIEENHNSKLKSLIEKPR